MAVNWRSPRVFLPAAALAAISAGVLGALVWADPTPTVAVEAEQANRQLASRLKAACASDATYDRLKQVAFDEAIRRGNVDPANLDLLSTYSLVRVEDPVVKSRDETLDVTLCSGRLILEVPPGAERAFGGERRLAADIEYAAQAAADGSGMVYQMEGAEPIIASLAAFDLKAEGLTPVARATPPLVPPMAEPSPAPVVVASASPAKPRPEPRSVEPAPRPTRAAPASRSTVVAVAPPRSTPAPTRSVPAAAPPQPRSSASAPVRQAAQSAPSFNCRAGRSRSEQMVCGNEQLASLDRQMSSQFYSALDSSDARVRAELRRSRDRFLSYRESCDSEACVAQAYRDRMDEIEDIAAGS